MASVTQPVCPAGGVGSRANGAQCHEAEANEILRTFDPISTMAQSHKAQLEVLPGLLEHRKNSIANAVDSIFLASEIL